MSYTVKQVSHLADLLLDNISSVIFDQELNIKLALATVLSEGNMLFEDVPGVGKTMLCRALAKSVGGVFARLQCTPDLLPSDLLGTNIYSRKNEDFVFYPGPVFSNVLLADELNRATPKMQSALLECMEERQVTVNGESYRLPKPFIVAATQNPIEYEGTFSLPEAQLDRFTVKLSLGYPSPKAEMYMLKVQKQKHPIESLKSVCTAEQLSSALETVRSVQVSDATIRYIVDIVTATRQTKHLKSGASPRASQALYRMSQAWAILNGRNYAIPDDVQQLAPYILPHRLITNQRNNVMEILGEILANVPVVQSIQKN